MGTQSIADNGVADTSTSLIYTVPGGNVLIPQKLMLLNDSSGGTVTAQCWVLNASGDSVALATKRFEVALGPKEDRALNISSKNVPGGGQVHLLVDTASTVSWDLSGTLKTQEGNATGATVGF